MSWECIRRVLADLARFAVDAAGFLAEAAITIAALIAAGLTLDSLRRARHYGTSVYAFVHRHGGVVNNIATVDIAFRPRGRDEWFDSSLKVWGDGAELHIADLCECSSETELRCASTKDSDVSDRVLGVIRADGLLRAQLRYDIREPTDVWAGVLWDRHTLLRSKARQAGFALLLRPGRNGAAPSRILRRSLRPGATFWRHEWREVKKRSIAPEDPGPS